jgi:hypothetical protein
MLLDLQSGWLIINYSAHVQGESVAFYVFHLIGYEDARVK